MFFKDHDASVMSKSIFMQYCVRFGAIPLGFQVCGKIVKARSTTTSVCRKYRLLLQDSTHILKIWDENLFINSFFKNPISILFYLKGLNDDYTPLTNVALSYCIQFLLEKKFSVYLFLFSAEALLIFLFFGFL